MEEIAITRNKLNCKTSNNNFEKVAMRVSVVTIVWNILLAVFKFIAGIIASSSAMVSDAIHSASDVFSTIVVMVGVKISAKESDKNHPYGHERLECVSAIILAMVLFGTGLVIGYDAFIKIIKGDYNELKVPGMLALIAAIVSIVVKELMFWYTRIYAKRIESTSLMADAWHHRSDALSSIGALIGVAGARMGYQIMDSLASLVIFIFIAKAAFDIFKDAINKLTDHACDEETEKAICEIVMANKEVREIDLIQTRLFGNKIYVDIEICVDGSYTLRKAHTIAEEVHDSIEKEFPKVKHIMVHVNPAEEE